MDGTCAIAQEITIAIPGAALRNALRVREREQHSGDAVVDAFRGWNAQLLPPRVSLLPHATHRVAIDVRAGRTSTVGKNRNATPQVGVTERGIAAQHVALVEERRDDTRGGA